MENEIKKYISENRKSGISDLEIRNNLISAGWPEQDIDRETKKRSKKIIYVSMASITALTVAILIFFTPLPVFIQVKFSFSKSKTPELYAIPQFMQLEPQNDGGLEELPNDFIQIKTPWGKPEQIKITDNQNVIGASYSENRTLLLVKEPDFVATFVGDKPEETEKIKLVMGPDIFKSNYSFIKAVFESSPDQLSLFTSRQKIINTSLLLLLKETLYVGHPEHAFYEYNVNDVKVFQVGGIGQDEYIYLDVFDKNDQQFKIGVKTDSQQDLDKIISSMRSK